MKRLIQRLPGHPNLSAPRFSPLARVASSHTANTDAAATSTRGLATASNETTYMHQASLPRLPVPPLQETLHRYVRSLQPLSNPGEFAHIKQLAQEMASSELAAQLQSKLEARSKEHVNWLEEWWDGGVYLKPRLSLPINYNYFLRFTDTKEYFEHPPVMANGVSVTAVVRAASLLHKMAQFKVLVDSETLTPDKDKDGPMCMNQYARLFGHARIPILGEDEMRCYAKAPAGLTVKHYATKYMDTQPRHILLMVGGQMFPVDILTNTGAPRPTTDIAADIALSCLHALYLGEPAHSLGPLTTADRDTWASMRSHLLGHSAVNHRSLDVIDSALWVVNMDELTTPMLYDAGTSSSSRAYANPVIAESAEGRSLALTAESPRYLYGRGDGVDRWFDKHQLIVARSGGAGLLLEHAPGDGLTLVRMMNFCAGCPDEDAASMDAVAAVLTHAPADHTPRALHFDIPAAVKSAIVRSMESFKTTTTSLLSRALHYPIGAATIKGWRLPPDAFVQMAFQLAHQKIYGFPGATYESTSTRGFAHGRTETTRSVSEESVRFVSAVSSSLHESKHKTLRLAALLVDACAAHNAYAKAAKAGYGVDRHLVGLRNIAAEAKLPVPTLLEHPTFARSRHWRMSTSNCGSEAISLFGFGPVVDDGFGVAYLINKDYSAFNITAWRGNAPRTDPSDFADALESAFRDMATLGGFHAAHHAEIHSR